MRIATILKVIKSIQNGAANKKEVQKKAGLSWGACSEAFTRLAEKEIIIQIDEKVLGSSGRGRKSSVYKFNSEKFLLAGIEIKKDEIGITLTDLSKNIIAESLIQQDKEINNDNILKFISDCFREFLSDNDLTISSIIGLSVSLTGGVDKKNMRWLFTPRSNKIKDVDLKQLHNYLPELGYITIEHDTDAQASSIVEQNSWQENNYVFAHFGEGVGISIFNHETVRGYRGFAGELGHIPYPDSSDNRICSCGKINCIETFLSQKSILTYINNQFGENYKQLQDIEKTILQDKTLLKYITDVLVFSLVIAINTIDPKSLLLGGNSIDPFIPYIKEDVEKLIKEKSWMAGPEKILWYEAKKINAAYGATINSLEETVINYIAEHFI